jgi:hypothetical protein
MQQSSIGGNDKILIPASWAKIKAQLAGMTKGDFTTF